MKSHLPKAICLPASDLPRIVVIGAGFAGINIIKNLKNKKVDVVLLDKNNFHQFQPLLYQVAISGLAPDSIVFPIRKFFHRYENFHFRMAEVLEIEPESQRIITDIGWLSYDYLVIATGSVSNYYGLNQIKKKSLGLKNIRDALNVRSWILQNLEKAVISCDVKEKDALTNFVIVGGGPAGVELAGALAEFKRYLLQKDYPEIVKGWMKIYLLEAGERLLPTMDEESSSHAYDVLQKINVEVILQTAVNNYDGTTVVLNNGNTITAKTMVWTAGVKGNCPSGIDNIAPAKNNRISVDKYNKVRTFDAIYAIGDVASMISDEYPTGHPMLAPVAIQQGTLLAKNLLHLIEKGYYKKTFKYKDKGSMATIGKNKAVAQFGKMKLQGGFAWVLWSTVHLFSITGFKNRFVVGINWMIHYFSYEKANRLIIRKFEPKSNQLIIRKLASKVIVDNKQKD